jgi:hypothetical protein
MNTLAKLIASIAALVASLALAWMAKNGVSVTGSISGYYQAPPIELEVTHT